jgi:hypothetical protein
MNGNEASSIKSPIMTNPISENLDINSIGLENYLKKDDSSTNSFWGISWGIVLLALFISAFIVFFIYKHITNGENIFEYVFSKIKELFESINIRFQTRASSKIQQHMREDHNVDIENKNSSENIDDNEKISSLSREQMPQSTDGNTGVSQIQSNDLKQDLNNALNQANPDNSPEPGYSADDSYSSIQKSKSSNKSGWCYIGEDRGFRSCIRVGENDTCMSGDIFPTSDICVNPNLRM